MKKFDTFLYFITDSSGFTDDEILKTTEEAIKGGASIVQLREKEKTTAEYISLAEKMHKITSKYHIPLIIDDRLDAALAVNAEGVHLGQSDMSVSSARRIAGDSFIIGATAKTVTQAVLAYQQGADYLGVGAIYPTTTKVKTIPTSTDTLTQICNTVPIPVNAIGGLNAHNLDILKGTGISGICVVSAIMKSKNPYETSKKLIEKIKNIL